MKASVKYQSTCSIMHNPLRLAKHDRGWLNAFFSPLHAFLSPPLTLLSLSPAPQMHLGHISASLSSCPTPVPCQSSSRPSTPNSLVSSVYQMYIRASSCSSLTRRVFPFDLEYADQSCNFPLSFRRSSLNHREPGGASSFLLFVLPAYLLFKSFPSLVKTYPSDKHVPSNAVSKKQHEWCPAGSWRH